jgi:MoxR-like ATPase
MTILDRTTGAVTPEATAIVDGPRILAMQHLVRQVVVAPHVKQYAARLVLATHPRAAQALVLSGKVRALVDGRFHVSYQDIQDVALPVLRHRVLLNFEAEADRVDSDALVREIMKLTPTQPTAMAGIKP